MATVRRLIEKRCALTGRPREVYEQYLTRPPRPGTTWEDALYWRIGSLAAGRLPADLHQVLCHMVASVRDRETPAA
ncbi:hypothetical protein [Marinactinospora rubrisoli]|uniref:Uncharacterized protein n=1 Tax=Marinactinospora rubrisoli TaxID=2715399 RepID=A0ABW2KP57_9ACTN